MNSTNERAFGRGWQTFEQIMRKSLAAMKAEEKVHRSVLHVVEHSLKQMRTSRFSALPIDVLETHRSVIVRVLLPDHVSPDLVHLRNDGQRLHISGIPDKKKETVRLPVHVRKRYKTLFNEGILEISMRKVKKKRLG
jgi:HSP20 family molecular chaperone IbpA